MTEDEATRAMAAKLAAVRLRFVERLPARRAELLRLVEEATTAAPDAARAARDDLRRGLHNLAGSAPTLGLRNLGATAGRLEAQVLAAPLAGGRLDPTTSQALAHGVSALTEEDLVNPDGGTRSV